MNVHFQCVIQVCRFNCPEPVCPDSPQGPENRQNPPGVGSVTSYAGPSFTTARSFLVPQQSGQVSQALPPVIPQGPQINQVLPPQVLQHNPQLHLVAPGAPPGLLPNQINIATHPAAPRQGGGGGRRRHGPPRGPSARVDPRNPLHRQNQHQSRYLVLWNIIIEI